MHNLNLYIWKYTSYDRRSIAACNYLVLFKKGLNISLHTHSQMHELCMYMLVYIYIAFDKIVFYQIFYIYFIVQVKKEECRNLLEKNFNC